MRVCSSAVTKPAAAPEARASTKPKNGWPATAAVAETAARPVTVLTMDSMQSAKSADLERGASYLSIMEENLEVLKQALA